LIRLDAILLASNIVLILINKDIEITSLLRFSENILLAEIEYHFWFYETIILA